jgi:hypothetical protein
MEADQLAASLGQYVNQVSTKSTFANSSVPVIQQLSGLAALAQQDAAAFQHYPKFDWEVTTFLNNVVTSGQSSSLVLQQQATTLASLAANGQTTSAEAQGLLGFLNNVYFGGLPGASFNGTSVTGITPTTSGTVWFTCANGQLGTYSVAQGAQAVTLYGVPVEISSLVIGGDGTAWFATTQGQTGYCSVGQTAATVDSLYVWFSVLSLSVTAGSPFAITVTAKDAAGDSVLDPCTIQFSSSDPLATLPPSYVFTNEDEGSHTFSITLNTTGSQTVTISVGLITFQYTFQVTS